MAETYRAFVEDEDRSIDGGRIRGFRRMRPSLRRRLDRLTEPTD